MNLAASVKSVFNIPATTSPTKGKAKTKGKAEAEAKPKPKPKLKGKGKAKKIGATTLRQVGRLLHTPTKKQCV